MNHKGTKSTKVTMTIGNGPFIFVIFVCFVSWW